MNTQQIIETAEEKLIHTYNRYQIVLDKGDGVRLYDTDGKEYLDFGAGIAVFALGYNNKEYNDALKVQIDKLIHTSNYFYNEPAVEAATALTKASGMDRVFFTNSGTEAIEGAVKLAKKYYYVKNGKADAEIIAMQHSFHGRSMGALSEGSIVLCEKSSTYDGVCSAFCFVVSAAAHIWTAALETLSVGIFRSGSLCSNR